MSTSTPSRSSSPDIQTLLAEFDASGQSAASFARSRGLPSWKLYHALNRRRGKSRGRPAASASSGPALNIAGQGGLVYLAGSLEESTGSIPRAWAIVFALPAVFFVITAVYHLLVLPRPVDDQPSRESPNAFAEWLETFASFFRKREISLALLYLLLYRLGEAQLVKMAQPFLLDAREVGGLGFSTKEVGVAYGTYGIVALTVGGLLGGWAVSRRGLRAMLWPMLVCMHLPNLAYVLLAWFQPESFLVACGAVVVEQLGYGFGFTAYMVFMMLVATGTHKTAHYAICTGFMALGMMLPGMISGDIQEWIGYTNFFVWVCVATLPSIAATAWLKVDPAFGRKA
jgi:PAT family beta-lactamase induction signal transducer AmpG